MNNNNNYQGNGIINLPYELYQSVLEKSISPDLSYIITQAKYTGICEENDIKLHIEYNIKVNNDNLKPAPTTNQSSKIMIKLFNTKATLLSNQILYSKSIGDKHEDGSSMGLHLIINDGYYNLYATNVGRYIIKADVSVPYQTTKNTGMELSIPKSSNNSVSFTVPKFETNIKIFNSFPDVSATNTYNNDRGKESVNNNTVAFVKLPGSERQLKINWTVNDDLAKQTNPNTNQILNVKPNIVVQQNILCSIGEGTLLFKTQFNYNIISGLLSTINIAINKSLNIINIHGDAIKKWEVIDSNNNHTDKFPNQSKLLQIFLDYGVEGNYTFNLTGEISMTNNSNEAIVHSMICLGDEISRQRGFLGIEARTNVEISETNSDNINVIDVQELPPQVHSLASHPILLSYKFLDQIYSLCLRVKKNLDCAVLVSICEEAHFISTLSYSGKTLHQMILKIKNTKQQFLKINVPFKYEVWTTLMDGIPVKPSFNDPFLLIPILKPGNKDSQKSILVEIILLETNPVPLRTTNGSYEIVLPKIDLQLRAAFSTVYLPQGVNTSKFTGNLKNVSYFSTTPPSSFTVPVHGVAVQDIFCSVEQEMPKYERRSSITKGMFQSKSTHNEKKKSGRGLIPVNVDMPTTNNLLYFEQILLSGDKSLNIKFDYKFKKIN